METLKLRKVELAAGAALLFFVILFASPSAAKPLANESTHSQSELRDCHMQEDTETLCQRCAKSTKSPMVYPMCCKNSDSVRAWCESYLTFGLQ